MLTQYTSLTPSDNTGQLCAVEQLSAIQNATGTVSANNLLSFVPQVITGGVPGLGAPQSMSCNSCTKEAYNIIVSNAPEAITSSANSSISGQCGADFIGPQHCSVIGTCCSQFLYRWENTHRNITDRSWYQSC